MHENEFLNLYSAKIIEYGLAILYLVLFVGFWRWVQGEPPPGTVPTPRASSHQHSGRTS
jgi:hypothetical protein